MKTILIITLLFLNSNLFAQKAIYTDNDGDGVIEYTLMDDLKKVLDSRFFNDFISTLLLYLFLISELLTNFVINILNSRF